MQLKLRHIILFITADLILIISGLPGGALMAMAVLMQLALLFNGIPLTKQSQLAALKLFLISVPTLFFWAGAHSFVDIYIRESSFLFMAMAAFISLSLCFIINFQIIFSYNYLQKNDFNVNACLQNAFNEIKNKRRDLLISSLALFVFTLVPWLAADWKLVFAITVTLAYLNFDSVKKAVGHF